MQSACTLSPYIGLFVIAPSEGYLRILEQGFKVMLRKLKEGKGRLLEEEQDDKGEGEKRETRTCQKGEA